MLGRASHALLAQIFRALEGEDSGGRHAIFNEELGLELALREVFKENARAKLLGKFLDQGTGHGLVVTFTEVLLSHEVVEVDHLHVGALAKSLTESGLSGGLGANDAGDLGEHRLSGVLIDLKHVTVGVDLANLAELLVVGDHRKVLLLVGFKALCNCLFVVVGAALATGEQAFLASLEVAVEEEDVLGLADIGLEVGALVDLPRETVNEVVLIETRD